MSSHYSRTAIFNLFHLMAHIITKILQHTKNVFFTNLTKKIGIILTHSHQMAIVLAAVIFLFDSLRKKRSVSLTRKSGIACFKTSCSTLVEKRCSRMIHKARCDLGLIYIFHSVAQHSLCSLHCIYLGIFSVL